MSVRQAELFGGNNRPPKRKKKITFEEFDRANPDVWREFERITLDMVRQARLAGVREPKVGSRLVWETLRWRTSLQTRGDGFKLSNNLTPHYARRFLERYPELGFVFATRPRKGKGEVEKEGLRG